MAAGDVKQVWAASSDLTVTNLHSLAASSTWLTGWESAVIDNTSNKYLDILLTGKLVTHASNRQAGEIRVYVVPMLDDTNYFDVLDGTESNAETFSSSYLRDQVAKLGAVCSCDNTPSLVVGFAFSVAALFGGVVPPKFSIWISGNAASGTNAQLASSGSQITQRGYYSNVAAA